MIDRRHQQIAMACCGGLLGLVLGTSLTGCSAMAWPRARAAVSPEVSKEQLVARLNSNILGKDGKPGLVGYLASNATIHPTGSPIPLPAMLAVEAPQNFRLTVSRPFGGQEVDIGSNAERFWIWTSERPGDVMTASHEDIPLALEQLQFPIPIHPAWLMEVFGVIPLDEREFRLVGPTKTREFELVSMINSPVGEDVERVIRVDVRSGKISSHVLRMPGGKILAIAHIEKYAKSPNGTELPVVFRLRWPDARVQMVIDLRNPVVNPASLSENKSLWTPPQMPGATLVDIGQMARIRQRELGSVPQQLANSRRERPTTQQVGHAKVSSATMFDAPEPAGWLSNLDGLEEPETFEWAQPILRQPLSGDSAASPQSPYSGGASQSSWDPPLRGRE